LKKIAIFNNSDKKAADVDPGRPIRNPDQWQIDGDKLNYRLDDWPYYGSSRKNNRAV
jgi:hypothetical protein